MRHAILLTVAIVGLLMPDTVRTMAQNVGGQTGRYLQGATGTLQSAPSQQPTVPNYRAQVPSYQPRTVTRQPTGGVYDQGRPVGRGGAIPTQPRPPQPRPLDQATPSPTPPASQDVAGPMELLGLSQVAQELQLTPEQSQRIGAIRNQYGQSVAVVKSAAGRQLTPQQIQILQAHQQVIQNAGPQLEQALSLPQKARLQQLELQNQGVRALGDPAVAQRLGLSPQQQAQVAQVAEIVKQRGQQQVAQGVADPAAVEEAVEQESMDRAMGVLSEDQRRAYQQMTGKRVKLAKAHKSGEAQPGSGQAAGHGQGENSGNRYGYQGAQRGQGLNRGQAGSQHGSSQASQHGQGNRYGYQGAQQGQGLNRGKAGTQQHGQAGTRHGQPSGNSPPFGQGGSASRSSSPAGGASSSRGHSKR